MIPGCKENDRDLSVGRNFRVIGTCNSDETTRPLSPRFLSRCNTIELFLHRIPGIDDEKEEFTRRWFRSMVAHWYGLDRIFGNQLVLLFIGNQGCGKGSFIKNLLPEHLQK